MQHVGNQHRTLKLLGFQMRCFIVSLLLCIACIYFTTPVLDALRIEEFIQAG